jgi:photosystem II stability/assembly factor-like uncharacterized protein
MATTLLVGTEKGLFILDSDDRRERWHVRGPEHKGWQVYSLLADTRPATPAIYAGLSSFVYGSHLQRSDDGGRTWTAIETGPRFPEGSSRELKQIWSIKPGPEPGSLWAGVADAALFQSPDGGRTWRLNEGLEHHRTRDQWVPGGGGLCLHTIALDPRDPDRGFVGISAVGMFRTDDGGRSWALKNVGVGPVSEEERPKYPEVMRCVHKFVQDPIDPAVLYQQNHVGVFRSRDAGDSWERIEEGLPTGFGFPMVMHPHKPRTLFIVPQESDQFRMFPGGEPGVYRTDDGGDHWLRTHQGLPEPSFGGVLRNSMTVDAHDQPGVYFGTSGGEVYASLDEGASWRRLPGSFPRVEALAALVR